jgi:hypothetical protein
MFIFDPELFNMMHVDTGDVSDGGVVERGDVSSEFKGECPGFGTVECCVDWEGKENEAF